MAEKAVGRRHRPDRRRFAGKEPSLQPDDILQSHLDAVGVAVLTGNSDAGAALFQLPFSIVTASASLKIVTSEDLLDGLDDFAAMLRSYGVTEMRHRVRVASFQDGEHVVGVYETRLMDPRRQALPTFHSRMLIGRRGADWQTISVHNTTNETRWPMLLTRLSSEYWLPEEN
jgi:hypothetical protein